METVFISIVAGLFFIAIVSLAGWAIVYAGAQADKDLEEIRRRDNDKP